MTDETSDNPASDAPEGVFGNLPKARPGTRSPRRDGASEEPPAPKPAPTDKAPASKRAPAPPPPEPEPPAATDSAPAKPVGSPSAQIKSVEDLAWAGIAVAAEAATAGVRFAGKALEAARKSIDRP